MFNLIRKESIYYSYHDRNAKKPEEEIESVRWMKSKWIAASDSRKFATNKPLMTYHY